MLPDKHAIASKLANILVQLYNCKSRQEGPSFHRAKWPYILQKRRGGHTVSYYTTLKLLDSAG